MDTSTPYLSNSYILLRNRSLVIFIYNIYISCIVSKVKINCNKRLHSARVPTPHLHLQSLMQRKHTSRQLCYSGEKAEKIPGDIQDEIWEERHVFISHSENIFHHIAFQRTRERFLASESRGGEDVIFKLFILFAYTSPFVNLKILHY